eukprot:TRINITY_DN2264_c0_g2_i1.p1 TRINITY_DN2264_c0_g2~~TRINITY_DN2264_c0_g2_i1.p1  ORF type:complete len:638 (-),score=93.50 TRINITY_DN2264_c0_g2_i1:4-1917(-)
MKLPKFEVALPEGKTLEKDDIVISQIYARVYCIHINSSNRELVLYQLTKDSVSKKLVIDVHTEGTVRISVIDNILVSHSIETKVSMMFDIKLREQKETKINFPLAAPLPISPTKINQVQISLYNRTWNFILPSFIVDIQNGYLWDININLDCVSLNDRVKLVDFLLRRTNSKNLLLDVIRMVVQEGEELTVIASIFDRLNRVLAQHLEKQSKQKAEASATPTEKKTIPVPEIKEDPSASNTITAQKTDHFWNVFINSSNNEEIHNNEVLENKVMELGSITAQEKEESTNVTTEKEESTNISLDEDLSYLQQTPPTSRKTFDDSEENIEIDNFDQSSQNSNGSPSASFLRDKIASIPSRSNLTKSRDDILASQSKHLSNLRNSSSSVSGRVTPTLLRHSSASVFDSPNSPNSIKQGAPDFVVQSSDTVSPTTLRSSAYSTTSMVDGYMVIEQEDMYRNVFVPVEEKTNNPKYMVAVLTEYIRTLNFKKIPVHSFLYELLIDILVRNNRFNQLHQFLQYHVISDSMHVACQLLSLETVYPPAYQLALDMLKRLSTTRTEVYDQIFDVLVIKGQLLQALRFVKSYKLKVQPKRLLEAAEKDDRLFYLVYNFFKRRKELDSSCEQFDKLYNQKFEENKTLV